MGCGGDHAGGTTGSHLIAAEPLDANGGRVGPRSGRARTLPRSGRSNPNPHVVHGASPATSFTPMRAGFN